MGLSHSSRNNVFKKTGILKAILGEREREREKEKERERISNGILALNALLLLLSTMKSSGLLVNGMKSQGQMQSKPEEERKLYLD